MAIDRGPWNALVDDDGSNLVGSVWNKTAIKTVILDPTDAALDTAGRVTLLYSGSGRQTGGGAESFVILPFAAGKLAMGDSLLVYLDCWLGAATTAVPLDIYLLGSPGQGIAITLTGANGGGDFVGPGLASYQAVLRATPGYAGQVIARGTGGPVAAAQSRSFVYGSLTVMDTWITAWSLYIRHLAVLGASKPLDWKCQIYQVRG